MHTQMQPHYKIQSKHQQHRLGPVSTQKTAAAEIMRQSDRDGASGEQRPAKWWRTKIDGRRWGRTTMRNIKNKILDYNCNKVASDKCKI